MLHNMRVKFDDAHVSARIDMSSDYDSRGTHRSRDLTAHVFPPDEGEGRKAFASLGFKVWTHGDDVHLFASEGVDVYLTIEQLVALRDRINEEMKKMHPSIEGFVCGD